MKAFCNKAFQISSNQQDWREFKPEVTKVTYNQHKSFIRCRAGNTQGSIFSEAQQLKVLLRFLC